jgi:hypothetical protein
MTAERCLRQFGVVCTRESLDIRLEPLRIAKHSSMLRSGNYYRIMQRAINIHMYIVETAPVAGLEPCRHRFDAKLRTGNVHALAGRQLR